MSAIKKILLRSKLQNKFIIRVYGIFINNKNEVLLSDEYELNTYMTKFPGGGLKYGEGTIECLKRECIEECHQEIEVAGHFYTTDFFQPAMFYPHHQLLSIYYLAKIKGEIQFKISDKPFDLDLENKLTQSLRWVPISQLNIDEITFPIDKRVAKMIKERFIEQP